MAVLFVILYYFVSSMIDVMALDSFIAVYSAEVWRWEEEQLRPGFLHKVSYP